jgi:hypothetical protein
MLTRLETLPDDINATTSAMDALGVQIDADASTASAAAVDATEQAELATSNGADQVALASVHAQTAAANAAFVGQWSDLSGALSVPASTYHNGAYWMLLSGIADVTTSEPGISSDWAPVYASISISGPASVYITASIDLTITDYDSSSTYAVSASRGTASIAAEVISYTAPSTEGAGSDTLTVTKNGVPRTLTLTINPAGIATPTWVAPESTTGIEPGVSLETSVFSSFGPSISHINTDWKICSDAAGEITVISSAADSTNKISWVPDGWEESTTYYAFARHRGDMDGTSLVSEWSVALELTTADSFAEIIGVVCTDPNVAGGTWVWIDKDGAAITPAGGYFDSHPVWGDMATQTIDGQSMVKIPKFYTKTGIVASGTYSGKPARWIADKPADGFALHPSFLDGGVEIDQFWYGAYQSSSDGTKMQSVGGVLPAVDKDLPTFQGEAAARNTGGVEGFMLHSLYQWSAVQWLYLVENKSTDSQTATGEGRVNESAAANVDATDVAQASYRGMVGLWGNVRQWMDGLKTDGTQICVWDRNGNKTWVETGQTRTAATGTIYPTAFMTASDTGYDFGDFFIGDSGDAAGDAAMVPDAQYFNEASVYVPCVGGGWSHGADAGLWIVNCAYASSYSHTNLGARLAKV